MQLENDPEGVKWPKIHQKGLLGPITFQVTFRSSKLPFQEDFLYHHYDQCFQYVHRSMIIINCHCYHPHDVRVPGPGMTPQRAWMVMADGGRVRCYHKDCMMMMAMSAIYLLKNGTYL